MAIVNGYCTLPQFKQRFGITTTDASRDTDLELVIQAASRKVDKYCNRFFYTTAAGVTRYFTAQSAERCYTDDFTAISALYTDDDGDQTYENTWATTDYVMLPANSPFGWPYTWLEIASYGDFSFPRGLTKGVMITGTWGWDAVPDEVREACMLMANRYWERRTAPFGVAGANEFGAPIIMTKLDPDVIELLNPFVRYT